ncbi:MAG: hypothetical protein HYX68_06980 [Planctomycetes bacterium]|jgi:hypothetical protein|nr:hypothetical protein [Planctomycetota bacterium]
MKSAMAYFWNDTILVTSSRQTTTGILVAAPPFFRMKVAIKDARLGETIVEALKPSGQTIPHPENWRAMDEPLIEFMGAESWADVSKNGVFAGIDLTDNELAIVPHRKVGNGGSVPFPEQTSTWRWPSSFEILGAELKRVLRESVPTTEQNVENEQ